MRAARSQPQHRVAGDDGAAIYNGALLHHADSESGQIVFAGRVHARHLGRLAADQRAAGLLAARRDALHDAGRGRDLELAAGKVIEEEQRLRALHQDVIDAHRHQVDADGVVAIELERELELGTHAIGAGNEHRLAILAGHAAQRAKAADAGHHFRTHRPLGKGLDVFDERIAGVDIYSGIAISKASRSIRFGYHALSEGSWNRTTASAAGTTRLR